MIGRILPKVLSFAGRNLNKTKQAEKVLDGVVTHVDKDGFKRIYTYAKGQLKQFESEGMINGFFSRSKRRYGENGSYIEKTVHDYGDNWKDVYITANNFKMPNGQIVTGSFGNHFYPSAFGDKIVRQNLNGRNSFISFYKDANDVTHTVQKTHSGIAWCGWDRIKPTQYM